MKLVCALLVYGLCSTGFSGARKESDHAPKAKVDASQTKKSTKRQVNRSFHDDSDSEDSMDGAFEVPSDIPVWVQLGESVKSLSPEQQERYKSFAKTALSLVRQARPSKSNIFEWGETNRPEGEVLILLVTKQDPLYKYFASQMWQGVSGSENAGTLSSYEPELGRRVNITYLLVDKIFQMPDGTKRPDGHLRMTTALAHELFGNVQTFLVREKRENTGLSREEIERKAFSEGVAFLERLRQNPELYFAKNVEQHRLQIEGLLEEQREGLRSWGGR